jgi:O-antigen ligase
MFLILFLILVTFILSYFFYDNLEKGLVFLIFFLPFERIPSFDLDAIGGTTVRVSQIIALAIFVAYFLMLLKGKTKIKLDKSLLFLGLYLLACLLSFTQAININRSILVFTYTLFVLGVYFLVINILKSKKQLSFIENAIYWSTFIVCLFGLYQFIVGSFGLPNFITGLRDLYTNKVFGFPRIQSVALEPLYFANFLLIPFSLFLSRYLSIEKFSKKYLIILLLITANIVLTLSRGGIAASLFILAIFFFIHLKENIKLKNITLYLSIILVVILSILSVSLSTYIGKITKKDGVTTFVKQATKVSFDDSGDDRSKFRRIGLEFFEKNPVLGVGIGNFGLNLKNHPKGSKSTGSEIINNEPIEILAETGMVGFISLSIFLIYIFVLGIKSYIRSKDIILKSWLLAFLAIFLGFVIQYQTFSTLYIMHIWVAIGILIALGNIDKKVNIKS